MGAPSPRRWPRRLLIGLNIFVALCVAAAGAGYGYVRYRLGQIHTTTVAGIHPEDPGQPENVLVVGSDSRANLGTADAGHVGTAADVSGQRSDVTMVLHIDPVSTRASVLSIPRDTYVALAGLNHRGRINEAFATGPDRLVQTIQADFGISINHVVEVNFDGFRSVTNALGGVNVYFPSPAKDVLSELKVPTAGCVHLNGDQALAYVRSRHYQYFEGGRWHYDPYSDLSRIQRQQDFIRRVLRKVAQTRNPLTLNALIGSAVQQVTVDSGLNAGAILKLARRFHSLSPDAVANYTLPTTPTVIAGADVLLVKQPDAAQTINAFLNGPSPPGQPATAVPPNAVRIRVLNGTGLRGQATSVAQLLQQAGFTVTGTGDADSFRYQTAVIRYGTGQLAKATELAAMVVGGAHAQPDPTLRDVDLVLVTGTGFGGLRPAAAAPQNPAATPTTTTTTAPIGPQATPGAPTNKGAPIQPQC
jgi:LCP family protein required for cell wall assembly